MMASVKIALLLWTVSAVSSASLGKSGASKRDTYTYPQPDVAFSSDKEGTKPKSNVIVETISSQGRYLPPSNPSTSLSGEDEDGSSPINVSFEAYEQNSDQPGEIFPNDASPKPSSTAAPVVASTTVRSKKPTGGLGAFKYYGGKGKSKSSSSTLSTVTAAPVSSGEALPTGNIRIQQPAFTFDEPSPSTYRPPVKNLVFDFPSPKNVLKPSKKEQKLADSRGEESSQGYEYDVGPGSYQTGFNSYSSGVVHQPSPSLFAVQSNAPAAGNAMGMGLSYMRQSSPYFSYHVMLD